MNVRKQQKGFTIIEVVLVLAIAGLIFLMVFIALPALQRNQRDSQRQNDLSRLQTAAVKYTTANRGNLPAKPADWNKFITDYMTVGGDTFIDPSGASSTQGAGQKTYQLVESKVDTINEPFSTSQNKIFYSVGYVCGSSSDTVVKNGTRKVAFRIALEGGGYHCVNN